MSLKLPLTIKTLLPGYRKTWLARTAELRRGLSAAAEAFEFSFTNGYPTASDKHGRLFRGFPNTSDERDLYRVIGPALPKGIDERTFRLAEDIVTRFFFPHLRPDLAPSETDSDRLAGFHGQHKDTIRDWPDVKEREFLFDVFRPKPDDVIIDCGAYIGLGDAAVAETLTDGRIVAIEPDSRCFELLQFNTRNNEIQNVKALHAGVWREDGRMMLATGDAQANTLTPDVYDGGGTEEVETRAIDSVVKEEGLDRVSMISLTVNGAEIEALQGGMETLSAFRPRMRIAGWYKRDGRPISDHVRSILEPVGYRCFIGHRHSVLAVHRDDIHP